MMQQEIVLIESDSILKEKIWTIKLSIGLAY